MGLNAVQVSKAKAIKTLDRVQVSYLTDTIAHRIVSHRTEVDSLISQLVNHTAIQSLACISFIC
jgi:hypothetical protein